MKYFFIIGFYLLYLAYVLIKVVCFSIMTLTTLLWGFKIKPETLKNYLEFFNLDKSTHSIGFYFNPMKVWDYILRQL